MKYQKVLVLGATGKTGRRIVPRLRLRGARVRAASRSSSMRFQWAEPDGWDNVLNGVDAVYIVPPPTVGLVHDFVQRAEKAGVRHLVLLSGHKADSWGESEFGRDMRSAEEAVSESALEWTIVRSSNFAQNFNEDLWHAPLQSGELTLPLGDTAEPFIDLDDVADMMTAVLGEPARHVGRVYEVTGPRAITFSEAVGLISRASGLPMTFREIAPTEYTAGLIERGIDVEMAGQITEMFNLMKRGLLSGTSDDIETVLGRPSKSFEDYVVSAASAGAWSR